MSIELVVFDLAGTTVYDRNFVAIALKSAIAEENIEIEIADANAVMGIPKPLAIKEIIFKKTGKDYETDDMYIQYIFHNFLKIMIDFYKHSEHVREIEGVSATLAYLKDKGIKTAVDTGFSSDITEVILQRVGWREKNLLDFWVSSDQVERGRPYPDMIQYLMNKAGIDSAEKIAKVGDTAADAQQGINAGCGMVIGVLSGAGTEKELNQNKVTHLISSVVEIKNQNII